VADAGSTRAIVAALLANSGIAVTKFLAYALTGSSSMLAEAVHSVADTGNQVLLLVGGRRARRGPTPEHPFGYGRERYFFAFLVSVILFSLGGMFALYEAYEKWQDPHPIEGFWWWVPLAVLLIAIVLESFSLRTAVHESNKVRGTTGWVHFVRRSRSPELPVVLLEDTGALMGLAFALFGVSLTLVTGDGRWDAAGTAMIGVLLVAIAVVLGLETRSLLLGEGATPEHLERIATALVGPGVDRVIHMRTLHLGPEELLVAAKVSVARSDTGRDIAEAIDAAERRVREAVPIARVIYLEPDIDRSDTAVTSPAQAFADAPTPSGS
jgi:cation diffusion facilitator family transporter